MEACPWEGCSSECLIVPIVKSFFHIEMKPSLVQLVPITHCPPHGTPPAQRPSILLRSPLYVLGCCGVPTSLLQEKGLNFFSLSSQGRFFSPWVIYITLLWILCSLLCLWVVGARTVHAQQGWGPGR